jgi:hypothetical protein
MLYFLYCGYESAAGHEWLLMLLQVSFEMVSLQKTNEKKLLKFLLCTY